MPNLVLVLPRLVQAVVIEDRKGLEKASEIVEGDGDAALGAPLAKHVNRPRGPVASTRLRLVGLVHKAVDIDVDKEAAVLGADRDELAGGKGLGLGDHRADKGPVGEGMNDVGLLVDGVDLAVVGDGEHGNEASGVGDGDGGVADAEAVGRAKLLPVSPALAGGHLPAAPQVLVIAASKHSLEGGVRVIRRGEGIAITLNRVHNVGATNIGLLLAVLASMQLKPAARAHKRRRVERTLGVRERRKGAQRHDHQARRRHCV